MQLEYHKAAEEKGVYAISACGFDSIPSDLGTVYLMNKFKGLPLTFIVWKSSSKAMLLAHCNQILSFYKGIMLKTVQL
jgi:short subunit dehydrogenase-like uncharacterized protein